MVFNMLQVKRVAVANSSMTAQLAQAMLSDSTHLAFIISRTGLNKRLLRTAQLLKQQGTKIVLFSTSHKTPLAKYADEFLYVANTLDLDYIDMGGMIFSVGVRYYQDVLFGLLLAQDYDDIEIFTNRLDDGMGHFDDNDRLW
jgi:DNA-binding MurR/RpiR family transcriptional regulator